MKASWHIFLTPASILLAGVMISASNFYSSHAAQDRQMAFLRGNPNSLFTPAAYTSDPPDVASELDLLHRDLVQLDSDLTKEGVRIDLSSIGGNAIGIDNNVRNQSVLGVKQGGLINRGVDDLVFTIHGDKDH